MPYDGNMAGGADGNFNPIGTFNATFDGNGFTIMGLNLRQSTNELGLFATLGASSMLRRLGLTNSTVMNTADGRGQTGILVGKVSAGKRSYNCLLFYGHSKCRCFSGWPRGGKSGDDNCLLLCSECRFFRIWRRSGGEKCFSRCHYCFLRYG